MASTNEITGDKLITKGMLSKEGEDNFDKIFGVKKKERWIPPPLPVIDNEPLFNENHIDVVGQNGDPFDFG